MNTKDLRIAAWNANGIIQRQQELQAFLDTQKIDVCLISETHLTAQEYIKFRGYITYSTAHPQNTARGGSAVIIKETIAHYEDCKYETELIQATAVVVKTGRYKFAVSAVYSPPRHRIETEDYQEFLQTFEGRFIIGGDLNAKNTRWGLD